MGNHFYGSYHWELSPIEDRVALLDALKAFATPGTNLFIESHSPSIRLRVMMWRMRADYRTDLIPDTLSPRPTIFHVGLTEGALDRIAAVVDRSGLTEQIAHIKGYAGDKGLFWFHGFGDECDETLCLSRHVSDETVASLAGILGVEAEKKLGELKSDRERHEDLTRLLNAMEKQQGEIV